MMEGKETYRVVVTVTFPPIEAAGRTPKACKEAAKLATIDCYDLPYTASLSAIIIDADDDGEATDD